MLDLNWINTLNPPPPQKKKKHPFLGGVCFFSERGLFLSYKVHTHRQLTLGQAGSGCRIVGRSNIFGRIYRLLNFFFFEILVIFGLKQPWNSKIFHTNFTPKNVQKTFFSICQNLTRNDHRPSLGSKEDSENYFWWFLIDFGHILVSVRQKKKKSKFWKTSFIIW